MDDNKKFWQRFARIYSPFMERGNSELYDNISVEVAARLSREMNVLELACGSGQLSFRLASKVKLWEATDFSENMIAEAKKKQRPSNLFFSVQDATALPYADESFDAVMIANALHIMPEPDKAMAEIRHVVRKDGILFAPAFIHGEGAGYHIRIKIMSLVGFKTFTKWSAEEFAGYIEAQGFLVEDSSVMGSTLTPLCCLIAKKSREERNR